MCLQLAGYFKDFRFSFLFILKDCSPASDSMGFSLHLYGALLSSVMLGVGASIIRSEVKVTKQFTKDFQATCLVIINGHRINISI